MLQEQEEKLRQNIDVLQSTQEEMKRNQQALDAQTSFLKFILDNIPFPVFVKDEKGRYSHVNNAESKLFNLSENDLIGKDDSYFVNDIGEWKIIKESDENVLASDTPVELPLQYFTTAAGASYVFSTTKIPFVNNLTGQKNILGVSIDLTEKLELQNELIKEKKMNQYNTLMNIAGRQRMLSQKIGFCAEMLVQGKKKHATLLREAIELYEHSLQVLTNGGIPMGITCENPLPSPGKELLPYLEQSSDVWKLYKKAAENILYFSSLENDTVYNGTSTQTEKNITTIEEYGEILLTMSDNFVKAYMNFYKTKAAKAV
jgi:PAS domain S-box-containing protein